PVGAVRPSNRTLGLEVREQWEVQVSVVSERGMTPAAVYRNADELCSMTAYVTEYFVIQRHLVTADRTPVGRVECEDHGTAAPRTVAEMSVRRRTQDEIRSGVAGLQQGRPGRTGYGSAHDHLPFPLSGMRIVMRKHARSRSASRRIGPGRVSRPRRGRA